MSAQLVFKTQSAAAVQWWLDVREQLIQAHRARLDLMEHLTQTYGPGADGQVRRLQVTTGPDGNDQVVGMESAGEEWLAPPTGWRFDVEARHLVPALSRPEGQEIARRLSEASGVRWRKNTPQIGIRRSVAALAPVEAVYEAGIVYTADPPTLYQLWATQDVRIDVEAGLANSLDVEWQEVDPGEWEKIQESLGEM